MNNLAISADQLSISANYARLLARDHSRPDEMLATIGLSEILGDDEEQIPLPEFLAFIANLDETQVEPGWHLKFASRTTDHFHGALTFAMMSAPTIGDGLEVFTRYINIRAPYLNGITEQIDDFFCASFEFTIDVGPTRAVLIETTLRILHDFIAMIGNVNLAAAKICLNYPQDPDRTYYATGFDCPVLFEGPSNTLCIPAPWCAIPNSQHDETVWSNAIARCDAAQSIEGRIGVVERTRAYIASALASDPAEVSIDSAAQAFAVSVRTLIRHLRNEGTTFSELRDSTKQEVALKLLRKHSLSVEAIADELGFSDASSFSRAFASWYGSPPGRYRREQL